MAAPKAPAPTAEQIDSPFEFEARTLIPAEVQARAKKNAARVFAETAAARARFQF